MATGTSGFEAFDHTADVGLRVWGRELADLFEQAGAGFIDLMIDPGSVRCRERRSIQVEGGETEELLVAWLEEILFALDAEGFAPRSAAVECLEPGKLRGALCGERFDPARHEVRQAVKAVTYHDLKVHRTESGYEVSIVFDV
jgi:SHS2 domain-containing protein